MATQSDFKDVLRWLVMLPAAAVGSLIASGFMRMAEERVLLQNLFQGFLGPDSFIGRAFLEVTQHVTLGALFVVIGVLIAPSRERQVALVLGGLSLVLAGVALGPALLLGDAWAIVGGICVIGGAAWGAHYCAGEFSDLQEQ